MGGAKLDQESEQKQQQTKFHAEKTSGDDENINAITEMKWLQIRICPAPARGNHGLC
jgi:hypothetical protein